MIDGSFVPWTGVPAGLFPLAEVTVPGAGGAASDGPGRLVLVGGIYAALLVIGVAAMALIWRPVLAHSARWERRMRHIVHRPFTFLDLGLLISTLAAFYLLGGAMVETGEAADLDQKTRQVLVQSVTFHWGILVLVTVLLRLKGVRWERAFGLYRGRRARDLGMGIAGYLAMMPVVFLYIVIYRICLHALGVEQELQEVAEVLTDHGTLGVRTYKLVLGAVLAPIAEELLFRGIAFPLLARHLGPLAGMIVLSAVFAGVHGHIPSLLPLFVLSTILCMAYAHTGSIRVPIVMHILFNSFNLTVLTLLRGHDAAGI